MPKPTAEKLLTVAQVSELTGLSASTIYEGRCETDALKRIKLRTNGRGRATLRFYESDVANWIAKRVEAAQPQPAPIKQPKQVTAADRIIDMLQYKKSRQA